MKNTKNTLLNNKVNNLKKAIKATKGRIFSLEFTKKDGKYRKLIGRIGVYKGIKNKNYKLKDGHLLTVFDMNIAEYRTINLYSVFSFASYGRKWNVF